ncbi:Efflux transporter, RND family, MFP subunit [Verrucomicrobia bacterium]|nr:Efflux transporter, RND family, MFP subunit [Verrucomicrobiota bacterium]
MPNRRVLFSPVAAGLFAAVLCVTGCGARSEASKDNSPNLPTAHVRVQTLETASEAATEEVVGTVRSKLHATLEAKLSGRIDSLPVLLGQRVKAGDLLVRLDAAEIAARLDQANAALDQADREWKRVSGLFAQQAATRSEYDAADAHDRQAKAATAEAKAMLGYVEVRAPFDGVVAKKYVDEGDQAIPGKPLVAIEDPSALELEADVPEGIASIIHLDGRLGCRVGRLNPEVRCRVSEIAPAADPASRTFRVKLQLPEVTGLMSGQFARLAVPIGESRSLRAPAPAVLQCGQLDIVFKVVDRHAQLRLVKTGRQFGNQTEILAGLQPGDLVVVEGAAQLTDGQPVETQ